jgi:hypothetical protein
MTRGHNGGSFSGTSQQRGLRLAVSNAELPAPTPGRSFDLPAPLARLRSFWSGLRRGGELPRRVDITPCQIGDLLDCTLLVERIAPGVARVRIAGMRLSDLLGMDLRGMPLSALILPGDRAAFAAELEPVFARPAQVELWLRSDWGIGRPALDARLMLLPVIGDGGKVDRALGYMLLSGDVGRAPRRFCMRGTAQTPVGVPRAAPPARGAAAPASPSLGAALGPELAAALQGALFAAPPPGTSAAAGGADGNAAENDAGNGGAIRGYLRLVAARPEGGHGV